MPTLTIRIDDRLDADLSQLADATHRTKSDLAREVLRKQVAILKLRQLREQALPHAERAGIVTDDDVFDRIS